MRFARTSELTVSIQFAARFKQESSTVFRQPGIAARLARLVGSGPEAREGELAGAAVIEEGLCEDAGVGSPEEEEEGFTLDTLELDGDGALDDAIE